MHHRLLVSGLVVGQHLGTLVQRLTDPGDVAVTEDPEAAAEEAVLDAVSLDVLVRQEANQRLGGREPHGPHAFTSADRPSSSCWSSVSSLPPAIIRTSSCWSRFCFGNVPIDKPRFRITKRSPTG